MGTSARNDFQRDVARIALAATHQYGFALAGSGAIREHQLTDRPTEDVDLFTVISHRNSFSAAVTAVREALTAAGYDVQILRDLDGFAQLQTSNQTQVLEIDLGIDYRAEPPTQLQVGPVLAESDAVGNKIAALFSRGEARDYLDAYSIRTSGRFTDQKLYELAKRADNGFTLEYFAMRLQLAERLQPRQVEQYGLSAHDLQTVKASLIEWAAESDKFL